MSSERISAVGTLESLGVVLEELSPSQARGDCPFCGKEGHFFVNPKTGQWDCKVCVTSGNLITFLGSYVAKLNAETTPTDWARVCKRRSTYKGKTVVPIFPPEMFKPWGIGYTGTHWLIPCFSDTGTVRSVLQWDGRNTFATKGLELQLGGLDRLVKATKGSRIWICEGPWDAFALQWLLGLAKLKDVAVFVPSAGVFKQDWCDFFKGMDVVCCYDNDKAGDAGGLRAGKMLKGTAKDVQYLNWPRTFPEGFDTSDLVLSGRGTDLTPADAILQLEGLVQPVHRSEMVAKETAPPVSGKEETPLEFPDVLKVFEKWVWLEDDFVKGLAVCLATTLGNEIPGDPVWMYLVGPAGSGKTLILLSLKASDRTLFYSTLTPASLVSGYNTHPDPSLLPTLNGKTAVFKDGTELLSMNPDARREAYGVLRGAFDGVYYKKFGNGVERNYTSHFNLIIGMTPAVHGDSQATMGERFLKFEMRELPDKVEGKIRAAVGNIAQENELELELSEACRRFLLKEVDPKKLPAVPEPIIDKVVALAQIVSILRASVERDQYGDREVKYRPGFETGTRLAKQMTKLAQMLTYVYGVPKIDAEIYKIVQKVALDTSVGYHVDIVRALLRPPRLPLGNADLVRICRIPSTTLMRRLNDLEHLGVVGRFIPTSAPVPGSVRVPLAAKWTLARGFTELWDRAFEPSWLNGSFSPGKPLRTAPAGPHIPKNAALKPQIRRTALSGKKEAS